MATEGEAYKLCGKLQEAQKRAHIVEVERDCFQGRMKEPEACTARGQVQEQQGATGSGTRQGTQSLLGVAQGWQRQV